MITRCAFCNQPSYTGVYTEPSMCEKHFDLILVAHRAARRENSVSIPAIRRELNLLPVEIRARIRFQRKEIPTLLRSVRKSNYRFFQDRALVDGPAADLIPTQERNHANSN